MPRMTYSGIRDRIKKITNRGSTYDSYIKDAIQWGLDEICTSGNLRYLSTPGFITTIAPYTDGSVDVTEGNAKVTGNGTTFTESMVGRKFRLGSEEASYRIKAFVGITEITLEVPYQGATVTDNSYSLYKDEYRLPSNLDQYKVMRQIEEGIAMVDIEGSAFDFAEPTPTSEESPYLTILRGSRRDIYNTGTISGTVNTSTITGLGTGWLSVDGLGKQSRITIGNYVYTVKSVDTDLQITIYEKLSATFATSAYEALMDNLVLQFYYIPDKQENIYFWYQRLPEILYNDIDIPDLPDQYHFLLVIAGEAWTWKTKDKDESIRQFGKLDIGIARMKTRLVQPTAHTRHPRHSISSIIFEIPGGPRSPASYGYPYTP